ncbi:MAG: S41 family peptidase [Planctomycetota bacterium]
MTNLRRERWLPRINRLAQPLLCLTMVLLGSNIVETQSVFAQNQPAAGMMQYPDVSETQIVFSYANDLWIVEKEGGVASPLASPEGIERFPRFSPDGKQIAFSGNYEGGTDLYTINARGGVANRVTYHPSSEALCDWTPNGKSLLFSTNGYAGLGRQQQLFTVSTKGGLADSLPVPYGSNGTISPDNKWLAYTPYSRDSRTWKRYRGGLASDIWLFHLKDKTSKQITDFEGTDSLPMWHKKMVYYLSDAGKASRLNIWSYDTESGDREQVTKFDDYDCKWPSIGPGSDGEGEIVFSNGPHLYLLNLKTRKSSKVSVTIPGDRPTIRSKNVDAATNIVNGDISPTGKRVTIEARGDIWSAPVKNGSPRNLTHSSGVAERSPLWSPDGRWIAYVSDKTGEYEVYVTQSDGRGETKQLTDDGNCWRSLENWSPNSKFITFSDKTGKLFLLDVESKDVKLIDTHPYAQNITPNWSRNSQWLVYDNASNNRAGISSIYVYNVEDGTRMQLTADYFNDQSPTFDAKGEYIFFRSNRFFNSPTYEDLGTTFIYDQTEVLVAMPLRSDVKNPMLAKVDEVEWKKDEDEKEDGEEDKKDDGEKKGDEQKNDAKDDKDDSGKKEKSKEDDLNDDQQSPSDQKPEEKSDDAKAKDDAGSKADDDKNAKEGDDKKDAKDEPFEIEFDGIEQRAFQVPVGNGGFGTLAVNDKNHLLFSTRPADGKPAIKIVDISADKVEAKTVAEGAFSFTVSGDYKKVVTFANGKLFVINAAASQKLDKPVSTNNMLVRINPREEWRQILREAWRLERDFFYDPTMHGVDWDGVWKQYEPMLDDCVSRADVGFLIREMISELNVGHAYYRGGGDAARGPSADTPVLGCRFMWHKGAYKMTELYQGGRWDVDARNPLAMAGVKEGQYLLAINDQPLSKDLPPYEALNGAIGSTVTLTVSDDAKLDDDDQRVAVKPMRGDTNLRFRSWIEAKRKYVEDKTDGKVGYIYVVNTGIPGQNDLVRQFFAQLGKDALIIDDRWNGGGQIPTRFIELLNRPVTNYWARRDGLDWTWPPDSHQGPKCMLINGPAGSGGDMFPALFKQNKLGKLIGKRTWGGLVGISGGPSLIDGASVTMPSFAYYEKDGTWGIEGHGVDPDIEVVDDPAKMVDGGDPQLDVAIKEMLKEIEANGFKPPKRPAYPDRSKFGIENKDR